jgi:hypothetical protein
VINAFEFHLYWTEFTEFFGSTKVERIVVNASILDAPLSPDIFACGELLATASEEVDPIWGSPSAVAIR